MASTTTTTTSANPAPITYGNIESISFRDHARKRTMWLGNNRIKKSIELCYSLQSKFYYKEVETCDSFTQLIIECFTNAIDQNTRYPTHVTSIGINLDPRSGYVSITNNGPGFRVVIDDKTQRYKIELACAKEMTGENFDDKVKSYTGGTNGLGLKLINAYSDEFIIETVGPNERGEMCKYKQHFYDGFLRIDEPTITPFTRPESEQYTTIKFKPDYKALYDISDHSAFCTNTIDAIRARLTFMSAWIMTPGFNFRFNDQSLHRGQNMFLNLINAVYSDTRVTNTLRVGEPTDTYIIQSTKITVNGNNIATNDTEREWELCVVVANFNDPNIRNMSLVNSLFLTDGDHMTKVLNKLTDIITKGVEEKPVAGVDPKDAFKLPGLIDKYEAAGMHLKPSMVSSKLRVFIKCRLPSSVFGSQAKNSVVFGGAKTSINFSNQFLKAIYDKVYEYIERYDREKMLRDKTTDDKKKLKTTKTTYVHYEPARYIKTKCPAAMKHLKKLLFIVEGESAANSIKASTLHSSHPKELIGVFSMTGVPPNVRKAINKTVFTATGESYNTKNGLSFIEESMLFPQSFVSTDCDDHCDQFDMPEDHIPNNNSPTIIRRHPPASIVSDNTSSANEALTAQLTVAANAARGSPISALVNTTAPTVVKKKTLRKIKINTADEIADGNRIITDQMVAQEHLNFEISGNTNTINNLVLNQLQLILGLIPSSSDCSDLTYDHVVIATDRDLDGIGNICGLLINWIYFYWPRLVVDGFIKILMTPLVRLIPRLKGKKLQVISFGLETEFKDYYTKNKAEVDKNYEVHYYKGLGKHEDYMMAQMFKDINKYMYEYKVESGYTQKLETYFGSDTSLRKIELAKPVINLTPEQDRFSVSRRMIMGESHLDIDTKLYQQDNLVRKLPNVIDGLIISRRKAVFGGMHIKNPTKLAKLFNVTGQIASISAYHHGDSSMNGLLVYLCQSFLGGRKVPLFIGSGATGSRQGTEKRGIGSDYASPRYMDIKISFPIVNALFPRLDDGVLRYVIDDGAQVQPEFYVPILPYVIMETEEIPSHGWKQTRWARKIDEVITATRQCIADESMLPNIKLSMNLDGYYYQHIEIKESHDVTDEEGVPKKVTTRDIYLVNNPIITNRGGKKSHPIIIQFEDIPPRVGSKVFKRNMLAIIAGHELNYDSLVVEPRENDRIFVELVISADSFNKIMKKYEVNTNPDKPANRHDKFIAAGFHPFALLFKAYTQIQKHLNFIMPNNIADPDGKITVKSYNNYINVFRDWFYVRKQYYTFRIERQIEILKMQILYNTMRVRFILLQKDNPIVELEDGNFEAQYVKTHKLIPFDTTIINSLKPMRATEVVIACIGAANAAIYQSRDNIPSRDNTPSQDIDFVYAVDNDNKDVNYSYLLNITGGQYLKSGVDKLTRIIEKHQEELNDLLSPASNTPFVGAKQWLHEIDNFEKVYAEGVASRWAFDEDKSEYFK